ncbi:TonB-dependent receptor [Alteromonas sp. M12]|uniref:TonB-dependent receptor n=1 Tax=Alteromonas sp. M12 TaxID=3135644 RepID=UPI00319E34EB
MTTIHTKTLVTALSILAISLPAISQVNENDKGLEQITVTAQKRSQSINDVGMSITAVNAEEIASAGINDVGDLAKITPGMTTSQSLMGTPTITIRGIGFNGFTLGSSPAVSVYVDQVASPFMEMTRGITMDIERVEVLKGPQGILFGQNSTGGAVNYIAAKPTDQFEGGIKGSYGSFNETHLEGFVSGPLSDKLNARLAMRTSQGGDWQENYTRSETHGERDFTAARLLLDWSISEDVTLQFNFNGWQDKSDSILPQFRGERIQNPGTDGGDAIEQEKYDRAQLISALPVAPDDARATNWGNQNANTHDDNAYQMSLRADITLSNTMIFTSITSYDDYSQSFSLDRDGTDLDLIDITSNTGEIEDVTQEFRLSGETDNMQWVVGANYMSASTSNSTVIGIGDATNTAVVTNAIVGKNWASAVQKGNHEIEEYAVFGNIDYLLSDQLTLSTGIRFTDSTKDFEGCTTGDESITALQSLVSSGFTNPFAITPGDCVTLNPDNSFAPELVQKTLAEDNISWRLGLNYKLNRNTLLYATASQGYKSGSFPVLSAPLSIQLDPTTQEDVLAYEAGFKWSSDSAPIQLNSAVFYYDYSDKQVRGNILAAPFGVLEKLVNVPEAHVQGAEVQFRAIPLSGLTTSFTATILDSDVDQYVGLNNAGIEEDLSGSIIPFTPKFQANADAEYRFSATSDIEAFVGGSLIHNSKTNSSLGEPDSGRIDAFTVLDLRVGLASDDGIWNATLYGRNVTDEYYWTNNFASQDVEVRFAAKPATFGIRVEYNFY